MNSLKRAILISMIGAMVSLGMVGAGQAQAPKKLIASIFSKVCLGTLPDYAQAEAVLDGLGFGMAINNGYIEFYSDSAGGVSGALDVGNKNTSCSVLHENLSENDAQQLALRVLSGFSTDEPKTWSYEGVPSGWTVPYGERVLYVIYNKGGLSSDIRDR